METITVKFDDDLKLPFITATHKNTTFLLLIDSGADFSSIRNDKDDVLEFIKRFNLKSKTRTFCGEADSTGICTMDFHIQGHRFRGLFKMEDHSMFDSDTEECGKPQVFGILGNMFFERNNAVINFSDRTLTLEINDEKQNFDLTE